MNTIPIERLIDLSVKENIVPDKEFHYLWDIYGQWQFDSLKQIGLKPQHHLLDVGCGPMRLGALAIPYLEAGHYYGIDAFAPYLSLGKKVLSELGIQKRYQLLHSSSFEFDSFGVLFDYAIAQSVLTHLSPHQIEACLVQLKKVMKPGSRLLFTYVFDRRQRGFFYFGVQPMQGPRIWSSQVFEQAAFRHGIRFSISGIKHPTQHVGIFEF